VIVRPNKPPMMQIYVQFYSYFRELTGCADTAATLASGATLGELHDRLIMQFPKLAAMKKSTLIAVGVDYQPRDYVLKDGDEVSLFPPVQGG
jgi:molybdopterin converting factor small subunit